MNRLIHLNKGSLSRELCSDIIMLYEECNDKRQGIMSGGMNLDIKHSMDMTIDKTNPKWKKIYNLLEKELSINVKEYTTNLITKDNTSFITSDKLTFNGIQIQRYDVTVGKYMYHHDFLISDNKMRCIAFLWYLNDVSDGGETEFIDFKVVPEAGKLILFPASWTYPHKANIPMSNCKYIMTGWLYENCI